MDEKLVELLGQLASESPMKTAYVSSAEEHNAVCAEMAGRGMHLAASSNAGCPRGVYRLTFLPVSAFKERPDASR